jgi:hypothetical protein
MVKGMVQSQSYKPSPPVAKILAWCLERVHSVPYRVTARWLFYRLVQEHGFQKKDYKNFLKWNSRARKCFYEGWAPDTLIDDTRTAHLRGYGYESAETWMESFKQEHCILDKYAIQQNIVEIWFEAEAMYSQFNYYTEAYHVTLRPFKGDASIDYKWRIAKDLDRLAIYCKPIIILYFGDYDSKGLEIPNNALRDIRAWCSSEFEFFRCGINREHIQQFNLTERPENPGAYQWEALNEAAAQQLILGNLEKLGSVKRVEQEEAQATARWVQLIENALRGAQGNG